MSGVEYLLRLVGGRLVALAVTLFVIGLFVVAFGMTPIEWVTILTTTPPAWVSNPWTPPLIALGGIVIIAIALVLNISSAKHRALAALSELLSEGIHTIWNFPVTSAADLAALTATEKSWIARVSTILRRSFPSPELMDFTRLGVVPLVSRDGTFNPQHEKILREYALREQRLRAIIARHVR